eukprot:TRINITY_DN12446_c0_g1_i15.p2 TRINITY_DN12446_c0_g1~~TRINITY_DN12446_c0_g1_i15.p2  ORF type:complete len:232 (+),score=22.98 TRINITY_DN12446_c0_g1_i15:1208-1903(+)
MVRPVLQQPPNHAYEIIAPTTWAPPQPVVAPTYDVLHSPTYHMQQPVTRPVQQPTYDVFRAPPMQTAPGPRPYAVRQVPTLVDRAAGGQPYAVHRPVSTVGQSQPVVVQRQPTQRQVTLRRSVRSPPPAPQQAYMQVQSRASSQAASMPRQASTTTIFEQSEALKNPDNPASNDEEYLDISDGYPADGAVDPSAFGQSQHPTSTELENELIVHDLTDGPRRWFQGPNAIHG